MQIAASTICIDIRELNTNWNNFWCLMFSFTATILLKSSISSFIENFLSSCTAFCIDSVTQDLRLSSSVFFYQFVPV